MSNRCQQPDALWICSGDRSFAIAQLNDVRLLEHKMRIDPKICTNAVILVTALFASISLADQPETDATSKPKPGELRSFEIAPTIKMQFCWIPPGVEQLGSSEAEQKAAIDSIFGHTPALESTEKRETRGVFQSKGFWFAKYPVTQEEWQAVMSDNPSDYKPAHAGID